MVTSILLILLIVIAFAIFGELVKIYEKLDALPLFGDKERNEYEG